MTMIVVVTGTNTDVGKTITTASAIAATRVRAPHLQVGLIKPAQTGEVAVEKNSLGYTECGDCGDVAVVRALLGETAETPAPLPVWEGIRYPEPLAPDMAARRAGMELWDAAHFADVIEEAARDVDVLFVEGAGGLLVGLGEESCGAPTTLVEIAQETARRNTAHEVLILLVSQPHLGMLNQCVLTWRELQRAGLSLAGIVFGTWSENPDLPMRLNADEVLRLTGVPVIGRIPCGVGKFQPQQSGSVAAAGDQWWSQLPWCDSGEASRQ
ncbi:ATP-dependent dethiobiotin synthetase BioD [Lawsonella clevelandensis]|uniref:ATP-dependent dethiobiotin synthetase BioD n=1 Tax=Lawsonella clevelandensis TaxID=1528099 RepID=UPI0023F3630A|nr:ATP-dependent dethiobiotin synthetase BioD [Lawsonella clevelandensis]